MLRPGELLIGDHNWKQYVKNPTVDGERKARGLVPRNYATHPRGCYAGIEAVDFPLIPQSEWSARIADKVAQKSQLSDIRMTGNGGAMIPSRDQNGKGYCWAHSGTSAHLLVRAVNNLPYADLSAYGIACQIKNFRDEGGWGAQGVDWQIANGVPTSKTWPQQSMSRNNVNDAMKADAAAHKILAGWIDLAAAQYDRKLTFDQVITLLLSNVPVVVDYNWWSHSVCAADAVDGAKQRNVTRSRSGKLMQLRQFEKAWGLNDPVTAGFGTRDWNSWGDSWSAQGMGVIAGSKAVPDGAVAPRVVSPAA